MDENVRETDEDVLESGIDRRTFLIGAAAGAVLAAGDLFPFVRTAHAAAFELPALPYPEAALEPVISSRTIGFHYGKHHKGYVDKLNELTAGSAMAESTLESIIKATAADPEKRPIFNAAAQVWNHTFYWNSMKPKGGGKPAGSLLTKIDESFGSFEAFKAKLADAATGQFGSGWAWLVRNEKGALEVVKTANADTPLTAGAAPLLTIDVWEHAYYLDYQNRRKDYVTAVINSLLNWDFASENLAKA